MILDMLRRRPFSVIAHRGGSEEAIENSLQAIRHSLLLGVDIVEFDVRATKDGEIVLMHDPDFKRLAGLDAKVRELTYKEIRTTVRLRGKEPVATLQDAIALIDGRIGCYVEIKEPETTAKVLEILEGTQEWCGVISFYPEALRLARMKGFVCGYIYDRSIELEKIECPIALPSVALADRREVQKAHELGLLVSVWTANTQDEVERLKSFGVEGIASDRPSMLLELRA